MKVAILGASHKPERYAYRAQARLAEHGHEIFPVRPAGGEIQGVEVFHSLGDIDQTIDVLTVYINASRLEAMIEEVIELKPLRIILNPGTESDLAKKACQEAGIEVEEACTLVLLSTGAF